MADPTKGLVPTGDWLRVGRHNGGDIRAEGAQESHMPRVKFYQDYKVTKKGEYLGGDTLLAQLTTLGALSCHCPQLENRARPNRVCSGCSSVYHPGHLSGHPRFIPDFRGGAIGLRRLTEVNISELVKRL